MITSTEQIPQEKIYFEDNSIYISNTKIKFNGVIEDDLHQENKDYVIQSENLVSAYKEDIDFTLELAIFFVMYAWSISNLFKESHSDYGISFGALLFFLSVIIATIFFTKYNLKKFKKRNKPLRIVGRQNGVSVIYQINIKLQRNSSELEILYKNIISNLIKVMHERDLKIKYKESNLDPKKIEETRLRILEETKRRLEKEERRLKQIQDKAKAKKEAALIAAKEEKEKFEQFQKMLISLYFNASNDCIKINHFKDYIELIQLNRCLHHQINCHFLSRLL